MWHVKDITCPSDKTLFNASLLETVSTDNPISDVQAPEMKRLIAAFLDL